MAKTPEQKLLDAVLASNKDKLRVGDYVLMARVQEEVKRGRLLAQIAWFLMATLAITLVLLVLHSVGLIRLPSGMIDKLSILFGVEVVTLLGVIVRDLTKSRR
jgi:hypothetical protein